MTRAQRLATGLAVTWPLPLGVVGLVAGWW